MQHKDKFCFLIDNYELALKYKHKRRNIDPGLYNSNRLNEQPFPATRARNTTLIRRTPLKRGIRPKQKKQQRNIVAVQPNVDILSLDTPPNSPNHVPTENEPHSNTEPDVSKKLSFIDSLIIIQKISQSTASQQIHSSNDNTDTSTEDVICLSDISNIRLHRPIKEFDVISGRYPFMHTVMF